MRREYVAIFSVKPAVRLPKDAKEMVWTFDETDQSCSVKISRISETMGTGSVVQTGLEFTVRLQADNMDEATKLAKQMVEGILSYVTLVNGVATPISGECIVYETTAGVLARDFRQHYHDLLPLRASAREFNHDAVSEVIEVIDKLDEDTRSRVARAVRWYRTGALLEWPLEAFLCNWIGLECLNPVLQGRLGVRQDETVSGIKAFICKARPEDGLEIYRKIHKLRVSAVHGKESLNRLVTSAQDYLVQTRVLLKRAIMFVLGMKEWDQDLMETVIRYPFLNLMVRAKILGDDPTHLGPSGGHPSIDLDPRTTKVEITDDGRPRFTGKPMLKLSLGPGVRMTDIESLFYGEGLTDVVAHQSVSSGDALTE
jgi:hypothetical protein